MQATFSKSSVNAISEAAFKARDNQALIHQYAVIAETKRGADEIVIARFYAPLRRGAIKTTCILWVWGNNQVFSSGYAPGIGHQKSAALADAISNAGIALSEDIAWRGDSVIPGTLLAVASANRPDAKIIGVFEAYN